MNQPNAGLSPYSVPAPDTPQSAGLLKAEQNHWLARSIQRGPTSPTGPLHGQEFFAKDLFSIENEINRAGSEVFDQEPPAESDAGLIKKARFLGASLMGTTNMDALAYGFISNNPLHGRAKNPWDPDRICGGSSGGSAAVVAAGIVSFSFGTDTSGSIRIPSAFCGVAGYKPSAGVFDASGIAKLSPTFDRPGLFASNARALKEIASVLSESNKLAEHDVREPKIGMLGGYFMNDLELVIEEAILNFGSEISARTGLEIGDAQAVRAAAYILVADEAAQVFSQRLKDNPARFDAETRCRLVAASLIKHSWYQQAIRVQREFTYQFNCLFDSFDILVAPCVPMIAPKASELDKSSLRASLGVFTQPISITGCPVVSLPLATAAGLPTAVQLIGPVGTDALLLSYAAELGR